MAYKINSKITYLIESSLNYFYSAACKYCGGKKFTTIDRKYFVTKLVECKNCKLRFRLPLDKDFERKNFYNFSYKQKGITTDLPSSIELKNLTDNKFKGSVRNAEQSKMIMESLAGSVAGKSILDYGCSWGYMTWQFQEYGMKVQGYEIAQDRAAYGMQYLKVDIVTDKTDLKNKFDFVFSSHVIEHINSIADYINLSIAKLANKGFLIFLSPNGSDDLRKSNSNIFHNLWGHVHPNMISMPFYKNVFSKFPYYIASSPYDFRDMASWDQKSQVVKLNGGDELLCIVKKASI